MEQTKTRNKVSYVLIIISLLFLFNPNISVIDIFPDFIAYFILSRLLIHAADRAPYFEEARVAFRRLGWLNLLKFVGLLAIISVKRQNFSDNDVIALVTITFAAVEAVLSVIAIKNLFYGLFHVGERTDASSTIRRFKVIGSLYMSPEMLCGFTYFFAVAKCFLYFLPTMFLLTRINEAGTGTVKVSRAFPITLLLSILIGIALGVLFVIFVARYAHAVYKEGKLFPAIRQLSIESGEDLIQKENLRRINFALNTFVVATFFSLELSLVESYDVNLLPKFIFASIMILAIVKLSKFAKGAVPAISCGILYSLASLIAYFFETRFLINYGYEKLLRDAAARSAYTFVNISAAIEFVFLVVFLIFVFKLFSSFTRLNTGIIDTQFKTKSEDAYYGRLKLKNVLFLAAGILAGLIKCISVFLHGAVKVVYTDPSDITQPTVIAPAIEWIGLVVFISTAIYIGSAIYYVSTLKDEIKLRNE